MKKEHDASILSRIVAILSAPVLRLRQSTLTNSATKDNGGRKELEPTNLKVKEYSGQAKAMQSIRSDKASGGSVLNRK